MLGLLVTVSTILVLVLLLKPSRFGDIDGGQQKCSVQIVVLGDIGRSPRMQYHALSIAKHGGFVQIIGYLENEPLAQLCNHDQVVILPLFAMPKMLQTSSRVLFLIFAPIKIFLQLLSLWYTLMYSTKPTQWMLVQNPPAIPTLIVATVVCRLRNTKLIIDWHNFGYSILALKLGINHPLVKASKIYEIPFARLASYNLTVTNVMGGLIRGKFHTNSPVLSLHDRPADIFRPLSESQRIGFLSQNPLTTAEFNSKLEQFRLLVSATSWTSDEDFSLLLSALQEYSVYAAAVHSQLPKLLVVITGKGPQKAYYQEQIANMTRNGQLQMVIVKTAWLSFEDYALLLGSADLGVSLHTSSSGVDLPMKVLDMFGTGLPVVGWNQYEAWPELVQENVNGRGFGSTSQLTQILLELFDPRSNQLQVLRKGAEVESKRRWSDEWDMVAGRVLGLTH